MYRHGNDVGAEGYRISPRQGSGSGGIPCFATELKIDCLRVETARNLNPPRVVTLHVKDEITVVVDVFLWIIQFSLM